MAWTELSDAVSGAAPSPRYGHGLTSANGNLYTHGGLGGSGASEIEREREEGARSRTLQALTGKVVRGR